MAFIKYGRFEKDTYSINSTTSSYVHNHYDNFDKVLKHNINSFDGLYNDFKSVWDSMLTDLIGTWENIQKIFIKKFITEEAKFIQADKTYVPAFNSSNPKDFLEDYNLYFKKIQNRKGDLVGRLQRIKKSTILVDRELGNIPQINKSTMTDANKSQAIKKAEERALKVIRIVWEDLTEMISIALNNKSIEEKGMENFMLEARRREEMVEEAGMPQVNFDFLTQQILTIFRDKFKLDLKDMNGMKKELEKIRNIKTLRDREIRNIFGNFTLGAITGAAGLLLEQGMIERVANDQLLSMVAKLDEKDSISKISYIGSNNMSQRFVGDHLTASLQYENSVIRVFTSDKLTMSLDIGSEFRPKTYTVSNDSVLTDYKWAGNNRDVLKWMRYNFNTLKVLNLGDGSKKSLSEVPDDALQSYFQLEKDITSLLIIPRFIEGVVDFAQNVKGVYGKNQEIYHTAMLYSHGRFIWTVDILKELQAIMRSSSGAKDMSSKGIATKSFQETTKPFMTEDEIYTLYTKKIEALRNNNITNYEQLMERAGIVDIANWKPIHSVSAWMEFSKILGGK